MSEPDTSHVMSNPVETLEVECASCAEWLLLDNSVATSWALERNLASLFSRYMFSPQSIKNQRGPNLRELGIIPPLFVATRFLGFLSFLFVREEVAIPA